MNRLFVDVDDTLIKWESSGGELADTWKVNANVVGYVCNWLDKHPEGCLYIWSSGGRDYARTWAERVFPGWDCRYMAKMPIKPEPGDTFLDDSPMDIFASVTIHPDHLEAG